MIKNLSKVAIVVLFIIGGIYLISEYPLVLGGVSILFFIVAFGFQRATRIGKRKK